MIQVTQETRAGWHVLAVRGRADSVTADELEETLRSAIAQHDRVAVDLAALDYISSAGLRAVIQAARAAEGKPAEFAVCSLSGPVRKVFDLSGMQHILRIYGEVPC